MQRIRNEGKTLRTNAIIVRVSTSPHVYSRVGIVVPKFGHSAVERNQLKRRLREITRVDILPLGISMDLVLWVQRKAYAMSFDVLRQDVRLSVEKIQTVIGRGS